MKNLHVGQGAELYWRDCAEMDEIPTERDFHEIIAKSEDLKFTLA